MSLRLVAVDPARRDAALRCLGATSGNKPFPNTVCRAVLSTDVTESLQVGVYWLLFTVEMLLPVEGETAAPTTVPQTFR